MPWAAMRTACRRHRSPYSCEVHSHYLLIRSGYRYHPFGLGWWHTAGKKTTISGCRASVRREVWGYSCAPRRLDAYTEGGERCRNRGGRWHTLASVERACHHAAGRRRFRGARAVPVTMIYVYALSVRSRLAATTLNRSVGTDVSAAGTLCVGLPAWARPPENRCRCRRASTLSG